MNAPIQTTKNCSYCQRPIAIKAIVCHECNRDQRQLWKRPQAVLNLAGIILAIIISMETLQSRLFQSDTKESIEKVESELIDIQLARAWDLLGGKLEAETIIDFNDNLKQLESAREIIEKILDSNPYNAKAHRTYGNYYHAMDNPNEAEKEIRKAIEIDPDFANYHIHLGNVLTKDSERLDEAEAAFRTAIRIDPNSAAAHYNLGLLLLNESERLDEAEAKFEQQKELTLTMQPSTTLWASCSRMTPDAWMKQKPRIEGQ